jgi:hypothetical protein
MKHRFSILGLFFLLSTALSAQLTIESIDGKKRVDFPVGSMLTIKRPTPTSNDTCECYHAHTGKLAGVQKGDALLTLEQDNRIYYSEVGIARNIKTQYAYTGPKTPTPVSLQDVISVTRTSAARKNLDGLGGTLMLLAGFHGLVTAPLLSSEARKTSDKIVWAAFGAGLVLVLLPNEKTYHIQQPKGKKKPLWRIKTP